jgi:hypothetical protein
MASHLKETLSPGQQTISRFVVPMRKRRINDDDDEDNKPIVSTPTTTQNNPVVIYDTDDNFTLIMRSEQQPVKAVTSANAPQQSLKPGRSRYKRVKHQAQQTVRTENFNQI